MTTNNLSIALSIAYEVELCNNMISLANMFSGAQGRFFHGFALSTHLWFEDGVNDGFVAVVGGQRTLILPVVLLGRQMVVTPYQNAEISVQCWRLM